LTATAIFLLRFLGRLDHPDDLLQTVLMQTDHIGWALAVSMGFALTSFIYSRFVAGMADVPSWTNLRGGSAWMVGNAIILVAISVGLLFRFFDNNEVIYSISWGIPIFMLAVSAEILINVVLNLYRPRIHGESPRPSFDSKSLSLFASPDSLFRSINDAINYQFGFDITSSWGYQLLLRSTAWLLGLGAVVLFAMSSLVVVEPTQQAVRIRQGEIVGGSVHDPGLMFKLPWPIEDAIIVETTRIRELPLTFTWKEDRPVILWTDDINKYSVTRPNPFIVNDKQGTTESVTDDLLSLVDVRAVLRYRVAEHGVLDWLRFGSTEVDRRSRLTQREMALLAISQHALTNYLQKLQLDDVIGPNRADLSSRATAFVQEALDVQHSGVEVVSVDLPLVSPSGDAAASFEEFSVALQGEARLISAAQGQAQSLLTHTVGDPEMIDDVLQSVAKYIDARDTWDSIRRDANSDPAIIAKAYEQVKATSTASINMIERGNGSAAAKIRQARIDRWTTLMDTWAKASRVSGQTHAFRAAPELYMQRMYMSVLARKLPNIRKYVIGINPERLHLDVELRDINPLLNFADSLESDDEGDQ
jgi:regulator of protease activity HflC (stomatin/prohibitin superfamily)